MLSDVWTILSTMGSLIAALASIMAILVSMLFQRHPSPELDVLGKVKAYLGDILDEVRECREVLEAFLKDRRERQTLEDQRREGASQLKDASASSEETVSSLVRGLITVLRKEGEATRRAIRTVLLEDGEATRRAIQEDRRLVWPSMQD